MTTQSKPFRDHSEIDRIEIHYWSSASYESYEDADQAKAVRSGYYFGYTAACDAIETACAVADLLQYKAHKDDIRARVRVGNRKRDSSRRGSFPICYRADWIYLPECYLNEAISAINELF
jgi:hypothetical protein